MYLLQYFIINFTVGEILKKNVGSCFSINIENLYI